MNCENFLRIKAHSAAAEVQLKDFLSLSKSKNGIFDPEGTFPPPKSIDEIPQDKKLDWQELNWGVSGVEDPIVLGEAANYFCVAFFTKDNSLTAWLKKVSCDFPLLDFNLVRKLREEKGAEIIDAFNGNIIQRYDFTILSLH